MNYSINRYDLKWGGKPVEVELRWRTQILLCELDPESAFPELILWVLEDTDEEHRTNRIFHLMGRGAPMTHHPSEMTFIGKVRPDYGGKNPDVFVFEYVGPKIP